MLHSGRPTFASSRGAHSSSAKPHYSCNSNNDAEANDNASPEELRRQRRRRRLARKTPEQRRKTIQYTRRHNEKDGRLFYCDYCDLFVSSSQRPWRRHLASGKHMACVRDYWSMAAHVEAPWLNEINEAVAKAQLHAMHRQHQALAGPQAVIPMPAVRVAPGIVIGGTMASANGVGLLPTPVAQQRPTPPVVVTVAGKVAPPPTTMSAAPGQN